MEDEILQELDSILKPAIRQSWESAKRMSMGADPRGAFLDMFKVEIDNTKVDISNVLQKLDVSTQGMSSLGIEPDFPENVEELPDINPNDYVKETTEGFEVWDGMQWVQVSKQANIKLEIFQNQESDNRPAVRIWAKDEESKTSILYVDYDIQTPGWDLAYSRTGDFDDSTDDFMMEDKYWESPTYQIAKNSRAIGSMTSGALTMRHIGNLTPWNYGDALKNANGWYRKKNGKYGKLSSQRGRGGGGHQKGAQRAAGKAKVLKSAGKVLMVASVAFSSYEIGDAIYNDYSNKEEVITKASVDVLITLVGAFGGPVGWVIAGTYFILNVSRAFGDWGVPSGISQDDYNDFLMKKARSEYGDRIKELRFEVDLVPPTGVPYDNYHIKERTIDGNMPKLIFER